MTISPRIRQLSKSDLFTLLRDSTSHEDVNVRLEATAALTRKTLDDPHARDTLQRLSLSRRGTHAQQQLIKGILEDTGHMLGIHSLPDPSPSNSHTHSPKSNSSPSGTRRGAPRTQERVTLLVNGRSVTITNIEAMTLAVLGAGGKTTEIRPMDMLRKLAAPYEAVNTTLRTYLKDAISNLHTMGYLDKHAVNRSQVLYHLSESGKILLKALRESGKLPELSADPMSRFSRILGAAPDWNWILKANAPSESASK